MKPFSLLLARLGQALQSLAAPLAAWQPRLVPIPIQPPRASDARRPRRGA